MNKPTSTLSAIAALLLAIVTGCQALAAPAQSPTSTAASTPTSTAATSTASPIVERCTEGLDTRGTTGFYASDPWETGHVVLTFDDGPHPTFTPRVLDLLAHEKMQATFFVVGRNISRDTFGLVQRMVAEGHTIGSHSYSHDVKMTRVEAPKDTVEAIQAQHEATAILIDVALMARSGDDFDAMFRQVFQSDPKVWLTGSGLKKMWRDALARHKALLVSRGFEAGARPYAVLYSRPPGGGPYVQHDGAAGIALHDAALEKLGMMNVLWHGASGDTVPEKRSDFAFLTENMDRYARKGGVLLIHDYIRPDALTESLDKIARDPSISIVSMDDAVTRKYACSSRTMGSKLSGVAASGVLPRGIFAPPVAAVTAPVKPTFALAR